MSFILLTIEGCNVAIVPDWRLSMTYMPKIIVVDTHGGHCYLNLQSTQDGLLCTYAVLHGQDKETRAGTSMFDC